ncbi:ABC transporter permease [Bacillus sp. FJAT-45350]|uniref:ABC transporter permease n=1 Tax=Bacillus sp. FJAT-45350 TaxID=2011014 RepID=UPI000BB79D07|nr:ABC transporter permease [Bacillus sp. FJAT-45350]
MNYFFNLVFNENVKIYKRPRAWVLLGLLVVMNLFIAMVMRYIFFDTNFTFWDHVNTSTFIIFVLNFISIIIAGDIVSSEFSSGTIKLVLIRPASRLKIILSKYVAVLLFSVLVVSIHLLSTLIFGGIFFFNSVLVLDPPFIINIILKYGFGFIEMIVISSFAMMLSVVTRSSVFSVSVPIFLLMSVTLVIELLVHYNIHIGKYILFANTNLTQYFLGIPKFEGMTLQFSIMIIVIHMVVFFIVSFVSFSKRDVNV